MDKKKRGRYFDSGADASKVESEAPRKGRSRKQVEDDSAQRKREEKREREKLRIKREIRREHLSGHKPEDYDITEKWDRESKMAVYSLFGLKLLLIFFVIFEAYHMIVFKKFFIF